MAPLCFYVFFILKLTLVAGQSVQYVLKGGEASLFPSLPSAPDDILWKHNGNKVITFDSTEENVFPPFEGRITLAWGTAKLTIEDVGFEDSGEYELDALIRNKLHRSQYMLKVLDKVSKPVIQCEMNEESGNATSGQRATLHCSSDSDTPEALTFKWNLEGKSHLGQALTIALGNEHDHMEYSCTATHSLHAETSVFMAKACYKEEGSAALDVIVPIVIAALILLAFCLFPFIFRHQIKRACFRQRKSDDVEKQTARIDSKAEEESNPLMSDIHRQETFASKQRLIQQSDFEKETPQKQGFGNVMQELRASKKFQERDKKMSNPEQTESQADTQTAGQYECQATEIEKELREIRSSSIRVKDKAKQFTNPEQTESQADTQTVQNSEPVEDMDEEKSSDVEDDQQLESKDESQDKDAENATSSEAQPSPPETSDESRAPPDSDSHHEDKTETDVTGDSSAVHSDQEETQKQPVSLLHPSNKAAPEENSQTGVAEPEINSDGESTPGPEVEDGQRDASRNDDLATNESPSQSEPSESVLQSPSMSSLPTVDRGSQSDPNQSSDQAKVEEAKGPEKSGSRTDMEQHDQDSNEVSEGSTQTGTAEITPAANPDSESETVKHNDEEKLSAVEQTKDPVNKDLQGDSNHESQGNKAENATAPANAPSSLPETTGENEEKNSDVKEQKTAPTKEDPQGDSNIEGQVNETENTTGPSDASKPTETSVDRGSQSDPNQSSDQAKVEEAKGPEKSGSRTDTEQHDQDSNEVCEGSTQTGTAEITPAANPGSEGEADESAHPTATALSQSTHNKESKDTDAANASSAQVSEETKDNTDKESDSSGSEQIDEAAGFREGQQQS